MPAPIDMARSGFYVHIGKGSAESSHVYVGIAAVGHVQAAEAFLEGRTDHAGESYCPADGADGGPTPLMARHSATRHASPPTGTQAYWTYRPAAVKIHLEAFKE